ncbi:MAG: peptidase M66, partial [Verrucomicrobia bacterium]|nr:peptidase M66 [Verrucomicrobiota bacterium]
MPRHLALLAGLLLAGHLPPAVAAAASSESALVFNTTAPSNDLKGDFEAQVLFAQSQVIPARPRDDDRQPRLVSLRKALLMVRPRRADATPISVTVLDGAGKVLGTAKMSPPALLPKTAYFVEGAPAGGIDFKPKGDTHGLIDDAASIAKLADKDGGELRAMLGRKALVEVATADGCWVRDIYLPAAKAVEGKVVRINAGAGYGSTVHYGDGEMQVSRGMTVLFKSSAGRWFREGELENNGLRYASDAWSVDLPGEWIRPGLSLRFVQGKATGELSPIDVGAPTQLLLHTIDLGFLTPPRGAFHFSGDREAHREYFQTLPASRLVVSQYAPLHFKEVMLPTGNGMVTLDNSLGNEFSHEVGHNYGLGHYVDGFKGSVHRSADQVNSTWGWDADKRRFIPNFSPLRTGKDATLEGQSQPPFDGRAYGFDAMAGGAPFSSFNRFTLYTPNSAALIQKFFESKAVFDPLSPTGFSRWNEASRRMEPFSHRLPKGRAITAPIKGLSEASLTKLLAENARVEVAMGDGNWTKEIPLPAASAANKGRLVSISHGAGYASTLLMNGAQVTVSRGFSQAYVSDGKLWQEAKGGEDSVERKPQAFGVAVVTLVGYYDPSAQLTSYVYPALHGSLGYCYADDSAEVKPSDCQLVVETK